MSAVDPEYLAIATAIIGVISSIITQIAKRHVPDKWRSLFALAVSVIVSVASILIATAAAMIGGWNLTWDVGTLTTVVFGVIGVAQTIYAAVYKLVSDSASDSAGSSDSSVLH